MGEADTDCHAFAFLTLRTDTPAMSFNHVLGDSKTHAGTTTGACSIGFVKPLEDMRQIVSGNSGAGIRNFNGYNSFIVAGRNSYTSSRGRELDAIMNQINNCLFDSFYVHSNIWQVWGKLCLDR